MRPEMLKLILGMALVTYLTRSAFLLWFSRLNLPRGLQVALKYVPVGVLTAIVVPGVLAPRGALSLIPANPYLWGALAAAAAAVRGYSPLLTMVAGVLATALARWVW